MLYFQCLKQYQTIKVIRFKINLSVTMYFVSRFFKTKLTSDFGLKLSHHIKE